MNIESKFINEHNIHPIDTSSCPNKLNILDDFNEITIEDKSLTSLN
jgi:hypothetical protein